MVELPEPDYTPDGLTYYELAAGVVVEMPSGGERRWFALIVGEPIPRQLNDKKHRCYTPEAAAEWLASRGHGPGSNTGTTE